ncbi:MAG: hypothetical protein K9W46_10640 [Candidatus Heimdallarchaeum endolithica]|uniref:Uncharacterized protein n=1 Tax=Candidatus Heimdallarchaeum endolithica TaxID=2876572 RepID=A0A9Y1BQ17_9ARCH|nr:MAG: hypothetical protein K9W46_10640 [Candidatus Heimdallarchaeum endolithica]
MSILFTLIFSIVIIGDPTNAQLNGQKQEKDSSFYSSTIKHDLIGHALLFLLSSNNTNNF